MYFMLGVKQFTVPIYPFFSLIIICNVTVDNTAQIPSLVDALQI